MKKFVSLLLVVMMLLVSVSALAESSGSPKPNPGTPTTTTAKTFFLVVDPGTVFQDYLARLTDAANKLDVFTADTAATVKGKVGETVDVYDMVALDVVNWTEADGAQLLEIKFATSYTMGTPVTAVLVVVKGGAQTEYVLDAEVTEDYVITVKWPSAMMAEALDADELVLILVAQPIAA